MARIPSISSILRNFLLIVLLAGVTIESVFSSDPFLTIDDVDTSNMMNKDNNPSVEPLIVSTMDGLISALNPSDGSLLWTVNTGPGDLLSSTLTDLEAQYNGQRIKLVPSLGGSLFRYNDKKLELLPVTADTLLKSSFKIGDNLIIVGGREIKSYGVNLHTGALKYSCSINGCQRFVDVSLDEDILVIERHTQTVCAINSRNGDEKWKFSVGEHRISLSKGLHKELLNSTSEQNVFTREEREFYGSESSNHDKTVSTSMKISMMQGYLWAFDEDKNSLNWSKKLASPIADVWQLSGKSVLAVDLFKGENLSGTSTNGVQSAILFVGLYNKNLYIKESMHSRQHSNELMSKETYWIPHYIPERLEIGSLPTRAQPSPTAIMLRDVDSSYENGIFFYEKKPDSNYNLSHCFIRSENRFSFTNSIKTAYHRWKEVIAFSCILSIFFNIFALFVYKKVYKRRLAQNYCTLPSSDSDPSVRTSSTSISNTSTEVAEPSSTSEYTSRYLTDFEPLECLGKGGFGVVFKAKNVIDDCAYAVKRIKLNCRDGTHEKVMREVKALAKLEHTGIVRYFNAWLESPPDGWQEEKDQEWDISDSNVHSLMSDTSCEQNHRITHNPLKPFDLDDFDFVSGTFSFLPSKNGETEDAICIKEVTLSQEYSETDDSSGKHFEKLKNCRNQCLSFTNSSLSSDKNSNSLSCKEVKPLPLQPFQYLYIQMQLCRKESLKEWLCNNCEERIRGDVLDIFYQIVNAVEYVHDCGLMHRDLKPSNIFFSLDGFIKIGDFGLVTAVTDDPKYDTTDDECELNSPVKHTGDVGTTLYMSPEQIKRQPYNHKVDIFSLGLIFCELLVPFQTQSERLKVLTDIKSKKFPKCFEQNNITECLLAGRLLASNPAERPQAFEIKQDPLFQEFSSLYLDHPRKSRSSRTISSSSDPCETEPS